MFLLCVHSLKFVLLSNQILQQVCCVKTWKQQMTDVCCGKFQQSVFFFVFFLTSYQENSAHPYQ